MIFGTLFGYGNSLQNLDDEKGQIRELWRPPPCYMMLYRPEEQRIGMLHFGPEARAEMHELLLQVGYPAWKIESALHCVAVHELYGFADGKIEASLEARILQDADRLDAIGAVGIARAFMFSGAHGLALWIPGEQPGLWAAHSRPRGSAITHFYEKLLKLADEMNTATARAWARARHRFMEEFLAEWEGHPSREAQEEE